jgi:hypothetical protein
VVVIAHGFWNSFSCPSSPMPFSSYTVRVRSAGQRRQQQQLVSRREQAAAQRDAREP